MLKKIKIKNFKSFKNFEIEFDKFNCIIAPNNAGKSNLVEALRFLGFAITDVKRAIEEFGGYDNIKNIFLEEESIQFECSFLIEKIQSAGIRAKLQENNKIPEQYIEIFKNLHVTVYLNIYSNGNWAKQYQIEGRFGKKNINLPLQEFNIFSQPVQEESKSIRTYPFNIKISYTTDFEKRNYKNHEILLKFGNNEVIQQKIEYLQYPKKDLNNLLYALKLDSLIEKDKAIFSGSSNLLHLDRYFYCYSFYPEIIKTHYKGGNILRYDGTNLVEVLNFIADKIPNNFEAISSSLLGIVEEIENIKLGKDIIDRNILLFEEKNKDLPFNIVSDGTINLLAIITALNEPFSKEMITFDEIEKHLHLKAIDYILEVLKSQKSQITFTTQSTEVINSLELKNDNLIFLYRDYEGFTKGITAKKIPNFHKKLKRYKDITTIIKNEVLGYLGDFDEN